VRRQPRDWWTDLIVVRKDDGPRDPGAKAEPAPDERERDSGRTGTTQSARDSDVPATSRFCTPTTDATCSASTSTATGGEDIVKSTRQRRRPK